TASSLMHSAKRRLLQDSRTKIELLRMQIVKVGQPKEGGRDAVEGRPCENSSLEMRVAELRHHLRIEAAVAEGAKNVVRQLSQRKVQDRRLLAEAQARMSESCQKVDLLLLSLAKRQAELPTDHPRQGSIRQDLVLAPARTARNGGSMDPPAALLHPPPASAYTSFFKPASLTGRLEVCLMGCQELLETVPGRAHLAGVAGPPGSPSEGRSSRELEVAVYWRDWRSLCGVKFLRLEDFLDNQRHGMCVSMEPQGLLFIEVTFINPVIERRPKLQRQMRIFPIEKGKNFLRASQMNMNFTTWGRLMIMSILPPLQLSGGHEPTPHRRGPVAAAPQPRRGNLPPATVPSLP
ncbi:hypothetical protein CRUP_001586, partial [Coryphaenoides rupestris]